MEGSASTAPSGPTAKPGWNPRLWPLIAGLGLGAAMIVAENHGYGGVFEWAVVFSIGTGIAIAMFWNRRSTLWYWPAVAFLVAAHLAALCLYSWQMLPSAHTGTFFAIKGAAGLDFAASALLLYLLHLILDPAEGSWTHTTNLVVAAIILFNVGIFGIGALVLIRAHNSTIASSHPSPSAQNSNTQEVLCNDGTRQSFSNGPPFCDDHRGVSGVR